MPRKWLSRWLSMLLVSMARADMTSTSNPTAYVFDGNTTYCFDITQSMTLPDLNPAFIKTKAYGDACPVLLSLAFAATLPPAVLQPVPFRLTVRTNFDSDTNAFNMTHLTTMVNNGDGVPVQIPHANLRACDHDHNSPLCDLFSRGNHAVASPRTAGNFSNGSVSFQHNLSFVTSGEKTVFAEVILPPKDPSIEGLHFLVFTTLTVGGTGPSGDVSHASKGAAASSESKPTSMLMIGVVAGAIALVTGGVITCVMLRRRDQSRKREHEEDPNEDAIPTPNKATARTWESQLEVDYQAANPEEDQEHSMLHEHRVRATMEADALALAERRSVASHTSNASRQQQQQQQQRLGASSPPETNLHASRRRPDGAFKDAAARTMPVPRPYSHEERLAARSHPIPRRYPQCAPVMEEPTFAASEFAMSMGPDAAEIPSPAPRRRNSGKMTLSEIEDDVMEL